MNPARLREVAHAILNHPDRFDLAVFQSPKFRSGETGCGATACIAGWAAYLWPRNHIPGWDNAQAVLDLTDDEAELLFEPPSSFWRHMVATGRSEETSINGSAYYTLPSPSAKQAAAILFEIADGSLSLFINEEV